MVEVGDDKNGKVHFTSSSVVHSSIEIRQVQISYRCKKILSRICEEL